MGLNVSTEFLITEAVQLVLFLVSLALAWQKLIGKVNGMGVRMKRYETECEQTSGRLEQLDRELSDSRQDRNQINRRLGETEANYKNLSEKLTEMRIDITGHLSEIKNMISEKDTIIRERLAGVERENQIKRESK